MNSKTTALSVKSLFACCCLLGVACLFAGNALGGLSREAFRMMEERAERGDVRAQWDVGLIYLQGTVEEGGRVVPGPVAKDERKAVKWFRRCAEQGSRDCESFLAEMYHFGKGVPKNMHEETVKWARKCAAKGDGVCERILAEMYYEGKGVPKNLQKATEYLRNCANKGVEGCEKLANLVTQLEQAEARRPCEEACEAQWDECYITRCERLECHLLGACPRNDCTWECGYIRNNCLNRCR